MVSRSASKFHVLHKRALDELRREIPLLDSSLRNTVEAPLRIGTGDCSVSSHISNEQQQGISSAMERQLATQMNAIQHEIRGLAQKLDTAMTAITQLAAAGDHHSLRRQDLTQDREPH